MFIVLILISKTYQIKIPLKLVKTPFQKRISNKISGLDSITKQDNTIANYLFGTEITIGSNKQPFTVILDTGSEILWVEGENVSSSKKYIPSNSQTSKRTSETLNYEYTSGKITGYFYNDQMTFLLSNSFYFYFGVSSSTQKLDYYFDGIMGLARQYNDQKYSILHTIKKVGGISSTKFSMKYDENKNNLYFYLDEIHDDFKTASSNLASCPLIKSDYYGKNLWLCNIVSLGIKQGDTIVKTININIEGLFDTGTNNIVFPAKYISDFESTLSSFDCYIHEEGYGGAGSEKAIYCRNGNNLPKITIGVKEYILTLGKSHFYNKLNVNNEIIYRLRFIFVSDFDICVIGQNFFYEYHTLFDDDSGVLKFYNDDMNKIVYHEGKSDGTATWVIVLIIVGSVLLVGGITTIIIIYFRFWRKKGYDKVLLDKEVLEMSSIKKNVDKDYDDDNDENSFNQIMSIKSEKIKKGININIHNKKK